MKQCILDADTMWIWDESCTPVAQRFTIYLQPHCTTLESFLAEALWLLFCLLFGEIKVSRWPGLIDSPKGHQDTSRMSSEKWFWVRLLSFSDWFDWNLSKMRSPKRSSGKADREISKKKHFKTYREVSTVQVTEDSYYRSPQRPGCKNYHVKARPLFQSIFLHPRWIMSGR